MLTEHQRELFHPTEPNQVWSMDFVADQLADSRRFRSLTVVDIYPRECMAIESGQRLKSEDVVMALNQIKIQRGVPKFLYCDNGGEFSVRPWICGPVRTECEWRFPDQKA
jgi:putative transposase